MSRAARADFVGGSSHDRDQMHDRLRTQNQAIGRLQNEADGLRTRLQHVEENKSALSNNRQFREA